MVEGFAVAASDVCLVIDGDLQHPPEKIPALYERFRRGGVDVVVASRYAGGGTAHGLADRSRVLVSKTVDGADEVDVPDPAARRDRPDDGLLPRRPPSDRPRDPAAAGLQDPARDPGAQEPARRRGALRLRGPARRRVQGLGPSGTALPHSADRAALRQDVAVRGDRRTRRDREPRHRVGAHRVGVDYIVAAIIAAEVTIVAQLPADRALRLPRHAGCRIRRAGCDSPSRSRSTMPRRSCASRDGAAGRVMAHLGGARDRASRSSWPSSCASCSTRSSSTRPARSARIRRARGRSSTSSTRRRWRPASCSRRLRGPPAQHRLRIAEDAVSFDIAITRHRAHPGVAVVLERAPRGADPADPPCRHADDEARTPGRPWSPRRRPRRGPIRRSCTGAMHTARAPIEAPRPIVTPTACQSSALLAVSRPD